MESKIINSQFENKQKYYIAIDLKSFFASCECRFRNLDPLTTNLVVADSERTEKTICLAVTPSLKAYGIGGRARLFEVVQKVKEVNKQRNAKCELTSESYDSREIDSNPSVGVSYIVATPQMALYIEYSKKIYNIYLRYVAPEDIHVYSIDEVFMDVTDYLNTYQLTPHELAIKIIREVLAETGITATAGIGTNMYLCKVAMDIVAKHMPADKDGVRIAELDEMKYRKMLWDHKPLTDFWRVGRGYVKKLNDIGIFTMGDIARCSIGDSNSFYNEDLLYKLFGINAELLIDHAWGYEPCTISEIKAYKPERNSVSQGQVLHCPYDFEKGKIIIREMTELLTLDMVSKGLVTNQIVLTVGYDIDNMTNADISKNYDGPVMTDFYGRTIPKQAHGTKNIDIRTSSFSIICDAMLELYSEIVNPNLLIRRVYVIANNVISEHEAKKIEDNTFEQMDLFSLLDDESIKKDKNEEKKKQEEAIEKERKMQEAMLQIKGKFGKNALLKGTSFVDGATTKDRNRQIGGHKA